MRPHARELAELGTRIRQRRKTLGYSQEKFAFHAGIDRSYMGSIERGERNVTFCLLCDLALALELELEELVGGISIHRT